MCIYEHAFTSIPMAIYKTPLLSHNVVHCSLLHHTVLFCTIMYYMATQVYVYMCIYDYVFLCIPMAIYKTPLLSHNVVHCSLLHHTALFCALYSSLLQHIVSYGCLKLCMYVCISLNIISVYRYGYLSTSALS